MNHAVGLGYVTSGRTAFPDAQSPSADDQFVSALTSGGDSRLAVDPQAGVNKYGCPPIPAPMLTCVSSCTATPVAARGFAKAAKFYASLVSAASPSKRALQIEQRRADLAAELLRYFGVAGIADAILCPSGTDALANAAAMLARERPGEPMTAILPEASETGAGVPLAVAGRWFDGTDAFGVPPAFTADTVEIALRAADGSPRSDDELVDAYAAAAASARGRPVVYLTHSSKTGLIAPLVPPAGAGVIVDASQSRIEPFKVAAFILQGWPVVVTGSKFFGGPAFAGAILFPTARLPRPAGARAGLGTVLRWIAAMDVIEEFAASAEGVPALLTERAAAIGRGIDNNPALVAIAGLQKRPGGWSDLPSIFTFAVRDPADRRQLLSAASLRPLYERLVRRGILLGQPVSVGRLGGLRIAIGARDLLARAPSDAGLPKLFAALDDITKP
jgi:hypothetical protein